MDYEIIEQTPLKSNLFIFYYLSLSFWMIIGFAFIYIMENYYLFFLMSLLLVISLYLEVAYSKLDTWYLSTVSKNKSLLDVFTISHFLCGIIFGIIYIMGVKLWRFSISEFNLLFLYAFISSLVFEIVEYLLYNHDNSGKKGLSSFQIFWYKHIERENGVLILKTLHHKEKYFNESWINLVGDHAFVVFGSLFAFISFKILFPVLPKYAICTILSAIVGIAFILFSLVKRVFFTNFLKQFAKIEKTT